MDDDERGEGEGGASTYAVTEEQATQPAALPATETSTLPALPADDALRGRVCLVTGATRGLGKATALGLARLGGTVVLLGRDERLLAAARDDVSERSLNANVSTLVADLASFDAIRRGAGELATRHPALHVLVHNAGVNPTRRKLSADGIDLTLAVNHLAPFLLTHELLPMLRRGAREKGARIVTVISMFERFGRIALRDLQGERSWIGPLAYTQSKLANVLFTYELASRLGGTGITANCVDPGLVATDLMREHVLFRPRWLKAVWGRVLSTPERGARSAIYAASAPELRTVTAQCFDRRGRPMRTSRQSRNVATRERLWKVSADLTGTPPDWPRSSTPSELS
jgi:NAD(P)-dependent dehydrogenase (short-subunit alcohol dehydrogenase family)